jgi:hypothetical protein
MRETIKAWLLLSVFLLCVLIAFCAITFPRSGGMVEVTQSNPKYQHPNKHFQNLVELLATNGEGSPYWHGAYLSTYCDVYGKDYEKIERCYFAYSTCENKLPLDKHGIPDLFAKDPGKEYTECLRLFVPNNWRQSLWFWIGRTFFNGSR